MGRKTFKTKITSPETIEQINPKNKKLMNLFLKDKNRKCSDATMKVYQIYFFVGMYYIMIINIIQR